MARRASRSLNPMWVGVAIIVVAAIVGAAFFRFGQKTDPFRSIQSLSLTDYYQNANGLQGNVYKIDGTIQTSLYSSTDKGRLITISVDNSTSEDIIPILIPASMNQFEIQRGNHIHVKVLVEKNGLLVVQQIDKA